MIKNKKKLGYHLIFEGPELVGKSYLMSQVYDFLETKYNQSQVILDGCHWFNSDVGIFGTELGQEIINHYLSILKNLSAKNVLFEKFHISDIVYNRLHFKREIRYNKQEKILKDLGAKIIFLTVKPEKHIFQKRIKDRLSLYPHYKRILRQPEWYLRQQEEYRKEIVKSKLNYLEIDMTDISSLQHEQVLAWLGEK